MKRILEALKFDPAFIALLACAAIAIIITA